jgi:hypothetical protein
MSAQDLINQYKAAAQAQEEAEAKRKSDLIGSAQDFFDTNCRIWLAAVWNELQVEEIEQFSHKQFDTLKVTLRLPVRFLDIPGKIEQSVDINKDGKCRWNSADIDFGYLDIDSKQQHVWIQLGTDEHARAVSPTAATLGYVLTRLAEYAPIRQANEQKHLARKRADALVFYGEYIPHIESEMKSRIQEFPDLEAQIREAAGLAISKIEEIGREREEDERQYVRIQEERENLQGMATYAWRQAVPFTLYLVTYGAFVDTDGDTITRELYSLTEGPGPDGYYRALDSDNLPRKIRPTNVLSVEEIKVTSEKDAPYEAKRYIELHSKRVEGASTFVYLPPRDMYAFDMDAVVEEMAA